MGRHSHSQQSAWAAENGVKVRGLTLKVRGTDVNGAARELKKLINREGLVKEMRAAEYYESKGTIRRREKAEAIRRYKRERIIAQTEDGQ